MTTTLPTCVQEMPNPKLLKPKTAKAIIIRVFSIQWVYKKKNLHSLIRGIHENIFAYKSDRLLS